jgi:O-antigen/teichoic acid export membrane protein
LVKVQNPGQDINRVEISSIVRGAGTVFFGTILGVGLKYLFELIVAKELGAELFGVFFFGFSIFKILERLAALGLNNGVLKFVSLFKGENDEPRIKGTVILSLKAVLLAGTILAIGLITLSHGISSQFFPGKNIDLILIVFAVGVIFTAMTEIFVFTTQAFQIMTYKVLVRRIIEPGISLLLLFFFLLLGWQIFGATLAFVIALAIGTICAFFFMRKVIPYITKKTPESIFETKKIMSFSWPLFFVGFFDLINNYINTLMLGYFKTSTEVGIYGATWRTAFIIPIILDSFNSIFAPVISDLFNRKENKKLEDLFKIVARWIFTISLPVTIVLIFFSSEILSVWGQEYTLGATSLIIICLAQLINCTTGSVGFVLMMTGHTKINLINNFIGLLLAVSLNLWLIPRYGVLGAALSLGTVLAIINIIRLIEVYILFKIHPYRVQFYKPILSAGIALFFLFFGSKLFLHSPHVLLTIALGSLLFLGAYILVLSLLGLEEEDQIILKKIKERVMMGGK